MQPPGCSTRPIRAGCVYTASCTSSVLGLEEKTAQEPSPGSRSPPFLEQGVASAFGSALTAKHVDLLPFPDGPLTGWWAVVVKGLVWDLIIHNNWWLHCSAARWKGKPLKVQGPFSWAAPFHLQPSQLLQFNTLYRPFLGCSRRLLPFPETSQSHLENSISQQPFDFDSNTAGEQLQNRVLGVTSWKGSLSPALSITNPWYIEGRWITTQSSYVVQGMFCSWPRHSCQWNPEAWSLFLYSLTGMDIVCPSSVQWRTEQVLGDFEVCLRSPQCTATASLSPFCPP